MDVILTIFDSIDNEDEREEFINTIFRRYMVVLDKKKNERDRLLSILDEKLNRMNNRLDALRKLMIAEKQGECETERYKGLTNEYHQLISKEKDLKDAFVETESYKFRPDSFYVIEGTYETKKYCEHDNGRVGMFICDGVACRCCSGFSGTHPTLFGGADKKCPCPRCYKIEDCENWVKFHDCLM